jgi:SAM-dependent methyltransferase
MSQGAMSNPDRIFAGAVPKLYDSYLVPFVFEPYAADLTNRLLARQLSRVLEIAAGTGVVTRALASALPESVSMVATDLNQAMLDQAAAAGAARPVEWRQADAMNLPFEDGSFDAVVCQFGVMFFPDKSRAFSEVHRVLGRGGVFVFNVWDSITESPFPDIVTTALELVFPDDPPRFLARVPHAYHDHEVIERDLLAGGFTSRPQIDTIQAISKAPSAQAMAMAWCQGTPLRNEIGARDPSKLAEATAVAARAIAKRFGNGAVESTSRALVVTVEK